MKTEQIAREINERKLYERWDKAPVTDKQVYAVILSYPDNLAELSTNPYLCLDFV